LDRIDALLDGHGDAALFGVTDEQLTVVLERRERVARRLDGLGLRVVREVDGRDVAGREGAAGTAALLRGSLLVRPSVAYGRVRVAAAVEGRLAATGQALRDGGISFDHAVVIESVVGRVHRTRVAAVGEVEVVLLNAAAEVDPGDLEKVGRALLIAVNPGPDGDDDHTRRAKRFLGMRDREDGMVDLRAVLDPEGAAVVAAAIDPLAAPRPEQDGLPDPRPAGRRRADALIELCRKVMNGGDLPTSGGVRPHVSVLVPFSTLVGEGAAPGSTGQGSVPLPKDVLDRVCCDASVRRVVFGPAGQPLDVGRAVRTATPAIRAAVVARDICCTAPGCDRPASWTDTHHLEYWNHGGVTSVANLALACGVHHDKVHYDGWKVRLGPAGRIEWLAPPWVDPHQTWKTNHIRKARDPYNHPRPKPPP
jgi:hypothetical protein